MTRAPLLDDEDRPPMPRRALVLDKPLQISLYTASVVTLGAALYLFFEGLALLKESDKQSPWRPGSNLWGYIVQSGGILLLWPGILGLVGCVLKHPVCLGAFAGATFIVMHIEITMASIYLRNEDIIRGTAAFDLTGGMASTIQFMDDHPSLSSFLAVVFAAIQVIGIFGGFLHGQLLLYVPFCMAGANVTGVVHGGVATAQP